MYTKNGWKIYTNSICKTFGLKEDFIFVNIFYNYHRILCVSIQPGPEQIYSRLKFRGCVDEKLLEEVANIIDRAMLNFVQFKAFVSKGIDTSTSIDIDLILNNFWSKGREI